MRTYFAILIFSAMATFLATPLVRRLAFRLGAVDLPSLRKIHREPMPRFGGLAVFFGFCSPWAGFYVLDNRITAAFQDYERLFLALIVGAMAMLVLGMWDDLKGLSPMKKLMWQKAVAAGLYFSGYQVTALSNPFGAPLELGWLSLPVSILWIVGITNAINLLDGIDGLAAGVTACIALSLGLIHILTGDIIVALLTLCLAGACLGFLPFNFAPARIFLGDCGSLFIGIVLACVSMFSLFKGTTAVLVVVPLILFGLPLVDTTSVVLGRLWRGQPLFQGDKMHLHHRLLKLGLTQQQAAFFLYVVTTLLGSAAVWVSVEQTPHSLILVAGLILVLAGLAWLVWRRIRHWFNLNQE